MPLVLGLVACLVVLWAGSTWEQNVRNTNEPLVVVVQLLPKWEPSSSRRQNPGSRTLEPAVSVVCCAAFAGVKERRPVDLLPTAAKPRTAGWAYAAAALRRCGRLWDAVQGGAAGLVKAPQFWTQPQ